MNALDASLPGAPRRRLVMHVRRWLAMFGIRPQRAQWILTWKWARNIALSYSRPMWPAGSEIAAQYMVLLLADMRKLNSLKLPYRATHAGVLPDELRPLVGNGVLALPAPDEVG